MVSDKKEKDTKENKYLRIVKYLSNMKPGETIPPTTLATNIDMHKDTVTELFMVFETMKEIGFDLIIDSKTGELKLIVKTNEPLEIKRILKDISNKLNDIDLKIDESKSK